MTTAHDTPPPPPAANPPAQLVLDLPHRAAAGAEDYLVSDCNAAALDLIECWPGWPAPAVFLAGPAGAGKSHLVDVWRGRSGAVRISAPEVGPDAVAALRSAGAVAIEDIDRGGDEKLLFHLLNQAREQRGHILITARKVPGEMTIALPDLRSRLRALPLVEIGQIDDALLAGLLVKLFADRQLAVEPAVVRYLATHMERSAEAARDLVDEIDREALAGHRRLTRALAAAVLRRRGA